MVSVRVAAGTMRRRSIDARGPAEWTAAREFIPRPIRARMVGSRSDTSSPAKPAASSVSSQTSARAGSSTGAWLAKSIWLTGLMPLARIARCMSVATVPGDSENTRMPRPRFSRWVQRVSMAVAAFDAQYWLQPSSGLCAAPEPRLTMVPDPCARITGSTARMPWKTPLKLMSTACAQARGSVAASGPIGSMTPALLISASIRPKASWARATAACTWLYSATSQVIASACAPFRRSRVATSVMPPAERASSRTAAPASAMASAAAAPMPRLAPVMITDLPES